MRKGWDIGEEGCVCEPAIMCETVRVVQCLD